MLSRPDCGGCGGGRGDLGLVINVDTVRRGQPVDIHYCSQVNEAWAPETTTFFGTLGTLTLILLLLHYYSVCYANKFAILLH